MVRANTRRTGVSSYGLRDEPDAAARRHVCAPVSRADAFTVLGRPGTGLVKRGTRGYQERAERKLLELWEPGDFFGTPIGCVATTFTFDAAFFEEECLTRFAGVQSDPGENDRVYVIEREEKLAQCFAAVIVDQAHVPTHRSLRWHVLTARVPRGIQHAKLTVLVWEHRIRVLIGSANLTAPGYRRNYENIAVFEFGPELDEPTPLEPLEESLSFLELLRELAPGSVSTVGPQAGLARFIKGVRRQIAPWPRPSWPRGEPRAKVIPIRPGKATIFDQIAELSTGSPPDAAWIQTPFFDDGDGVKRVVTALEEILAQRGTRTIWFGAPGTRLPDDTIQYAAPDVLREPFLPRLTHRFTFIDDRELDENNEPTGEVRPLHAKSIWLESHDAAIYCVGSSNFTCAGTGLARGGGNYELNVAYFLPDLSSDFVQICKCTYPPQSDIDLEKDEVRFLPNDLDRTTDGAEIAGLPLAFGEATFDPGPPAVVLCEIGPAAPAKFIIANAEGEVLLDFAQWKSLGSPASVKLPWTNKRPASHLRVTWSSDAGDLVSIWSVNIVDPNLLPPPEELRSLDLEELLQVLTSASPSHESVAKILRRRAEVKQGKSASELDPHRRIDTRSFLLQRMRRFATALEGLRERLERPAYSREALRWRLSGPFGAMALAQRLAAEDKDGAAFMISELARTVAAAKIPAAGELGAKAVDGMLAEALGELRGLAEQHPAPPNLAAYVTRAFEELGR